MSSSPDRISIDDAMAISSADQDFWQDLVLQRGWSLDFQKALIESYNPVLSIVIQKQEINLLEHYLNSTSLGKSIRNDIEKARKRMLSRESTTNALEEQMQNYGLIVGRIQSGKTGHMLGLAFACLSNQRTMRSRQLRSKIKSPASIVILLSSLIDDIRKQTYDRLDKFIDEQISQSLFVGPGRENDLTKDRETQEKLNKYLQSDNRTGDQLLLVTKKNHHVINKLRMIFEGISDPLNRQLSDVIIIDDECDYGSLDANHADQDMSKIETTTNRELRELILTIRNRFNCKCWYIGYTATPFSNLLDNPKGTSHDGLPTLFPRGFIYSIGEVEIHLDNNYYFGSEEARGHIFFDDGVNIVPFREEML